MSRIDSRSEVCTGGCDEPFDLHPTNTQFSFQPIHFSPPPRLEENEIV